MKWSVIILPVAEGLLAAIRDRRVRNQIFKRISRLDNDPEKQGKPLSAELANYRSVGAVGERYRIIYRVEEERVVVVVVAVGIRKAGDKKDVYELAKKLARLGLLDLDAD
jgi:mRNA interferase RelE/StbE